MSHLHDSTFKNISLYLRTVFNFKILYMFHCFCLSNICNDALLSGGYIMVSATLENKLVVRPYTPITSDDEVGYMDLMIKVT